MKCKAIKFFISLLFLLPGTGLSAQQSMTEEQQEKKFYDMIEQQVEKYASLLNLEDWQVFYVDSILTHDYKEMQAELIELNTAKVTFQDAYIRVQDKWSEATYNAFNRIFTEAQWAKYLKTGGAKDKKLRDKREAKRNQTGL